MANQDPILVCDQIDRLITTELGRKFRPLATKMYEAARKRTDGEPSLTYEAARRLIDVCKPGASVLIVEGFLLDLWMQGETDGPPGAAVLARAVDRGLGATPVFVTELEQIGLMIETCRAAGLSHYELDAAKERTRRFATLPLSTEPEKAASEATEILDRVKPAAIIAIEKPAANHLGVYHNTAGRDISAICAKVEPLFAQAHERGILTIGIGDGGNEVGMGLIEDVLRELLPRGRTCKCPCGGGTVAHLATDVLIPAFVSNWGGYGVAAALAVLLKEPDVFHDVALERRILEACGHAGGIDGEHGYSGTVIDRAPLEIHLSLVSLLRYMVTAPPFAFVEKASTGSGSE